MLTESFIAATLTPEKPVNNTTLGVHLYDLQPLPALRSSFKKSSSNPNCVAVSRTHVFVAQADKAVVHVYNRERNNQEATVPFPERIHSLSLGGEKDGAGILAMGTEEGRVILWELGTGRQVSTPQHHLQRITCLAVDPTSNFLLSGSTDSSIHIWSLPGLLSFSAPSYGENGQDIPFSPLKSLSSHRSAITAIAVGHSSSSSKIAVSASKDGTCIVWDFVHGIALHTYLLPTGPLCMILDPADRAIYVGFEDGSIQLVEFYERPGKANMLHDSALQSIPSQPSAKDRWVPPPESAENSDFAVQCIALAHDGTLLLSGHMNGNIHIWDVANGKYRKEVIDFGAPITSLIMLPVVGFSNDSCTPVKLHNVIKPRYGTFANGTGANDSTVVPSDYTFTAQITSDVDSSRMHGASRFYEALAHPLFPSSLLEEALAEFDSSQTSEAAIIDSRASADLRAQNALLSSQLVEALKKQQSALAALEQRDREEWRRKQDEEYKALRKKKRRVRRMKEDEALRKKEMGETVASEDEEMRDESIKEEDLSSSTNEMSDDG